ncbi:MAG: hypothetical protein HY836_18630 [Aquabacterium sp.]|uniref:hypothetical protein n=1 Tax=Aquabacterium sp. TaxID=1872578 RepID=UPI0025BFFB23|nr:hypothetical protein [Aquabacterium sp.]MBI5927608.1 hypothetical protein [Aquabacterium sp.]
MRPLNLDSLLGRLHQHATFHDAELQSLHLDFSSGSAKLQFLIPCGFLPTNELAYHCGTLEFIGLLFYFVEPSVFSPQANDRLSLWITSDGPLPDQGIDLAVPLPDDLPEQAFAHYFYSSTTNSFIVFAALEATFHWQ